MMGRRIAGRCVLVAIAAALLGGTSAHAAPAGLSSPNVEHVGHIPIAGGATSATVVDDRLYVVGWSTLAIFDVSDPADPVLLSERTLGFQFPHEDVDTDGEVLVLAETTLLGRSSPLDRFHIWDVSDPSNPLEVATLMSPKGDRSLTCLDDCTYAYGAAGTILDLRNPADPRIVGDWGTNKPAGRGFDVTEVASGMVLTSTRPMMLLDGRADRLQPALAATGTDTTRTTHFAQWPRQSKDRFILTSVETFGKPRCDAGSGPLMTWDAESAATGLIKPIEEFRLGNGTLTDGRPVVNKIACSAHVFDAHPKFHDGGLVALAHFDHGTSFVEVDGEGHMREVGYFMPFSGQTFSARWASADVVYAVDLERGIDVLRLRKGCKRAAGRRQVGEPTQPSGRSSQRAKTRLGCAIAATRGTAVAPDRRRRG